MAFSVWVTHILVVGENVASFVVGIPVVAAVDVVSVVVRGGGVLPY